MSNLQEEVSIVQGLAEHWRFQVGDQESAFGEVEGVPSALTVLGYDPLSLMMASKIAATHPAEVPLPDEIEERIGTRSASVTLEDGYAWLSLYDLGGKTADEVRGLFEEFALVLKDQGIAIGPECAVCGDHPSIQQPEDLAWACAGQLAGAHA